VTVSVWSVVGRIAADVLGVDAASLNPDIGPEQIETWDSVQHLTLILAIESHFALQFDPEEMDQMTTLGRMAEIVQAREGSSNQG